MSRHTKIVTDLTGNVLFDGLMPRYLALLVTVCTFPDVMSLAVPREAGTVLAQVTF